MQVSDILRLKATGGDLYVVAPETSLSAAIDLMVEKDIGSLVVMQGQSFQGMLSFREVMKAIAHRAGVVADVQVQTVMDAHPLTCAPNTAIDTLCEQMLQRHSRYVPVMTAPHLPPVGVVSFYDVSKAMVESQVFENHMLKAYISDSRTAM